MQKSVVISGATIAAAAIQKSIRNRSTSALVEVREWLSVATL